MTSIHSENFPRRLSILFHLVAAMPLSGFAVYHYLFGSFWLSVLVTLALLTVLLSLRQEWLRRDSLRYRQFFVLAVSAAIVYACYQVGIRGLVYVFPMASVFFFTFSMRYAIITGTVFSIASLLAALNVNEPTLVFRFSIGVIISMIFAYIFAFEVNRQKQALEQQAGLDELTGALNRRTLKDQLAGAASLKARHDTPVSLILVDLDHFKAINDRFGHLCGDQILIEFTRLIQQRVRPSDKVFRFGGEEFLIMLPSTRAEEARKLAESLRRMVAESQIVDGVKLTCSFGIAELQSEQSLDGWLQEADIALYQAKKEGRNRVITTPGG